MHQDEGEGGERGPDEKDYKESQLRRGRNERKVKELIGTQSTVLQYDGEMCTTYSKKVSPSVMLDM